MLHYAGDNVMSAFGADIAQEDDAERAVRCGLALLGERRAIAAELRERNSHVAFDIRVGTHTGDVLLSHGSKVASIWGHTVNVAARMEQTAPSGALRISDATYPHVRGLFDVEAQPPLSVKGVSDPMTTYLVNRAKPRAFRVTSRGIEGVDTRMIGRERELDVQRERQALESASVIGVRFWDKAVAFVEPRADELLDTSSRWNGWLAKSPTRRQCSTQWTASHGLRSPGAPSTEPVTSSSAYGNTRGPVMKRLAAEAAC